MNAQIQTHLLNGLVFDNQFVHKLPADPELENNRRQVMGACYSKVRPTQVSKPKLVAYSAEMAELLDMSSQACLTEEFVQVFAGNRLLPGMEPYAMCYGGHQFGQWAGQLGDGRAINLGEVTNSQKQHWTLQLKGAGPTPYSRSADGLAVLRSSVREFLCSEAMYHLGVPTTRALSLVLTGENVVRDMFYDGHPQHEQGAIVCRVAPSFVRFGNFQIFASRGEIDLLRQLVDFTVRRDFPHLGEPSKAVYLAWLEEVCQRTAIMVLHWLRVGFVHGVMNTDNMSILGLTIDYGPYGWLENYDPDWTPNTTDAANKRYRYGTQHQIALWNLAQLANAIYPLIEDVDALQQAINTFVTTFEDGWHQQIANKLGLKQFDIANDNALYDELVVLLQLVETDMTLFYRHLADLDAEIVDFGNLTDADLVAPLTNAYYQPEQLTAEYLSQLAEWLKVYIKRVQKDGTLNAERRLKMNAVNPKYVLRNYLAQLAIDKATDGDYSMISELQAVLRQPYDDQPDKEFFAAKRPDWARQRPGCSMLSCSS
ncbi:MAG: YdiU family protein [Methylococcaceae bacterium]